MPKPRELDADTRAILREEALREAEARRREVPGGVETQPGLGLDDGGERRRRNRKPEPKPVTPLPEDDDTAVANESRGALLPDIEEINSTLTSTSDRQRTAVNAHDAGPDTRDGRGAFQVGFFGVLGALIVAGLLYVFGPRLADAVPALTPAIAAYLDIGTAVLDGVSAGLSQLVDRLNGLMGETTAG